MTHLRIRRSSGARGIPRALPNPAHSNTVAVVTAAPLTPDSNQPLADYGLTAREAQIAFWVSQGKTNYEIGIILSINVRTVEKHVEHVLQKLVVENRTTAALLIADCLRSSMRADST